MTARTLTLSNPVTGTHRVRVTLPTYCHGCQQMHCGPEGVCRECQRRAHTARVADLEQQARALAARARCAGCDRLDCTGSRAMCPARWR